MMFPFVQSGGRSCFGDCTSLSIFRMSRRQIQ